MQSSLPRHLHFSPLPRRIRTRTTHLPHLPDSRHLRPSHHRDLWTFSVGFPLQPNFMLDLVDWAGVFRPRIFRVFFGVPQRDRGGSIQSLVFDCNIRFVGHIFSFFCYLTDIFSACLDLVLWFHLPADDSLLQVSAQFLEALPIPTLQTKYPARHLEMYSEAKEVLNDMAE